ncbi:MAG: hypothetical protein J6B03_10950 [Candidatus Homeothermus sp.]|nr:hypothetical protein [Candidatus Homeothermus sp.]
MYIPWQQAQCREFRGVSLRRIVTEDIAQSTFTNFSGRAVVVKLRLFSFYASIPLAPTLARQRAAATMCIA